MKMEKVCSSCKQEKDILDFYKGCFACKLCRSRYFKLQYIKNRKRIIERSRKWNIENWERVCELNKKWRNNNRLKVKEKRSREYQKNKNYYFELAKQWSKKNPEKYALSHKKYIARMPDKYIVSFLIKGTTLKPEDITKEIIELARLNLILKRLKKEKLLC